MNAVSFAWIIVLGYVAMASWLAYRGFRRTRSMESYAVGDRAISPYFVGLSLAAQLTSVATFVVNPGLIYAYGLSGLLGIGVAALLGIVVGLVVMSKGFRAVGERVSALTVPSWIGARYRSGALRVGFALLSLALITFVVMILVAMAYVLTKLLGIPTAFALAGVILFVFPTVLLGGVNASVYTNTVQALIMVVVALLLVGSGLPQLSDGLGAFGDRLAAIDGQLVGVTNSASPYFRSIFEVFVCNFIVGLAVVCQPHVLTKALYLKTSAQVNRYLATTVVVGLVFASVLVVGLFARLALPSGTPIDLVMPEYIATQFSPFLRVVIGVGMLCAGISTLEGLLLALSAILAADLYLPLLGRRRARRGLEHGAETSNRALLLARLSLAAVAVVAFFLALSQIKNPAGGSVAIFAQYGIYCLFSASFAPMVFGLGRRKIPAGLVAASALVAVGTYVGMALGKVTAMHNNPAVLSAASIVASMAVMVFGVALLRRRNNNQALASASAADVA